MLKLPPNIRASKGLLVTGEALNRTKQLYSFVEQQLHLGIGVKTLHRQFTYADYKINVSVYTNGVGAFTYGYCNIQHLAEETEEGGVTAITATQRARSLLTSLYYTISAGSEKLTPERYYSHILGREPRRWWRTHKNEHTIIVHDTEGLLWMGGSEYVTRGPVVAATVRSRRLIVAMLLNSKLYIDSYAVTPPVIPFRGNDAGRLDINNWPDGGAAISDKVTQYINHYEGDTPGFNFSFREKFLDGFGEGSGAFNYAGTQLIITHVSNDLRTLKTLSMTGSEVRQDGTGGAWIGGVVTERNDNGLVPPVQEFPREIVEPVEFHHDYYPDHTDPYDMASREDEPPAGDPYALPCTNNDALQYSSYWTVIDDEGEGPFEKSMVNPAPIDAAQGTVYLINNETFKYEFRVWEFGWRPNGNPGDPPSSYTWSMRSLSSLYWAGEAFPERNKKQSFVYIFPGQWYEDNYKTGADIPPYAIPVGIGKTYEFPVILETFMDIETGDIQHVYYSSSTDYTLGAEEYTEHINPGAWGDPYYIEHWPGELTDVCGKKNHSQFDRVPTDTTAFEAAHPELVAGKDISKYRGTKSGGGSDYRLYIGNTAGGHIADITGNFSNGDIHFIDGQRAIAIVEGDTSAQVKVWDNLKLLNTFKFNSSNIIGRSSPTSDNLDTSCIQVVVREGTYDNIIMTTDGDILEYTQNQVGRRIHPIFIED